MPLNELISVIREHRPAIMRSAVHEIGIFGSRVRGQYSEDSDWNFFIIVKDTADAKTIRTKRAQLRMRFHDYFPYSPIDIIIKNKTSFESEKFIINTISNEVFTEGIPA